MSRVFRPERLSRFGPSGKRTKAGGGSDGERDDRAMTTSGWPRSGSSSAGSSSLHLAAYARQRVPRGGLGVHRRRLLLAGVPDLRGGASVCSSTAGTRSRGRCRRTGSTRRSNGFAGLQQRDERPTRRGGGHEHHLATLPWFRSRRRRAGDGGAGALLPDPHMEGTMHEGGAAGQAHPPCEVWGVAPSSRWGGQWMLAFRTGSSSSKTHVRTEMAAALGIGVGPGRRVPGVDGRQPRSPTCTAEASMAMRFVFESMGDTGPRLRFTWDAARIPTVVTWRNGWRSRAAPGSSSRVPDGGLRSGMGNAGSGRTSAHLVSEGVRLPAMKNAAQAGSSGGLNRLNFTTTAIPRGPG